MDIQIKNYVFDKTAKTITFTDYSNIRLDSVRMVANVKTGVLIYTFADPLLTGSVTGNVLTLLFNTAAMNNTDDLQIIYNDSSFSANEANQTTLNNLITTLNGLIARLEPLASMVNSGQPALRTIPIGSVSTAVTGSVTATVAATSITNFGTGIPASEMAHDINNTTAILGNINNVIGK